MKSTGADLVKAEAQALDYIESLTEHERPDFVITYDFQAGSGFSISVAESGNK